MVSSEENNQPKLFTLGMNEEFIRTCIGGIEKIFGLNNKKITSTYENEYNEHSIGYKYFKDIEFIV